MPKWTEYKQTAKDRGSLALELYIVQSTPAIAPPEMLKLLPEHLAYQGEMEAQGSLVMAGPVSDETGEEMQGSGLIIYRADSLKNARKIAELDPMHAKGGRTFTVRRWLVNEGSLTISVQLSHQKVSVG
ncbi:YciI family protein [Falsihalocynthiibacter sp. S25ZX9]|uniref:YciI family protein n=1 Tax=Falsihalocynthiibacter sp. S25ZX9 TaxID=3240870 RepID=UPI00350FF141